MISSPMIEIFVPKTMFGTMVKLNGSNYLLWAQEFCIFIDAQNKLTHLLQPPPADTDPMYDLAYWRLFCNDMPSQQSGEED